VFLDLSILGSNQNKEPKKLQSNLRRF